MSTDWRRGLAQGLLAAALFGAATPLSKRLLADVPPQVLAGLFYAGAALGLVPALLRGPRHGARLGLPRDARNRLRLLGAVVFGGVLGPLLLLAGLELARSASVSMLLNLETTATAVLGVLLFREHLGRWAWAGNAGVLAAGLLLSLEGGRPNLVGALLVAAAALCWGLDNNLTALIDGITPVQSTFWKGLAAGATNLAIGLALTHEAPSASWLVALGVGTLAYGASIVLYISSAHVLGATRSQMVFATAPFFGVALAVLWLGEDLSPLQGVAFLVLVLALALLALDGHDHEHVHEPLRHTHAHRHDDGHHDHVHDGLPPHHRHTHEHEHGRRSHRHPHWPDLHHRHAHET
ncbi:MAG: DMT family transporter [Planctomycetes bacterium]|nr:DMT family transporter [Planctomycetota bacterium]